jgi:predicted Zn-dependent protease
MMKKEHLVITLLIAMLIVACSTVPLTGRRQLNFIPQADMLAMSFQQYDTFLKENPVSADKVNDAMVKRVGGRVQKAVEQYFAQQNMSGHLSGYQWEFNLVQSDQVNAWCMPGGKVVVYTGILPVVKDETGLAVVMGHEIAHAIAEHGNERMSQQLLQQAGGTALSIAMRDKPQETQALWMTVYGVGTQLGALLPYSRLQESEADQLGLIFMAMAGYDPNAAIPFWQRMSALNKGQAPPEFLSTHPSDATRIRKIQELIPSAMTYYKPR